MSPAGYDLADRNPLNFAWKIILSETLATERDFTKVTIKTDLFWFEMIF